MLTDLVAAVLREILRNPSSPKSPISSNSLVFEWTDVSVSRYPLTRWKSVKRQVLFVRWQLKCAKAARYRVSWWQTSLFGLLEYFVYQPSRNPSIFKYRAPYYRHSYAYITPQKNTFVFVALCFINHQSLFNFLSSPSIIPLRPRSDTIDPEKMAAPKIVAAIILIPFLLTLG